MRKQADRCKSSPDLLYNPFCVAGLSWFFLAAGDDVLGQILSKPDGESLPKYVLASFDEFDVNVCKLFCFSMKGYFPHFVDHHGRLYCLAWIWDAGMLTVFLFACIQIKISLWIGHVRLYACPSVPPSVCSHVRSRQSLNRFKSKLERWFPMILAHGNFSFSSKYSLLALLQKALFLSFQAQGFNSRFLIFCQFNF